MDTSQRHQPPGETSNSPQRPAQHLVARTLQFNLAQEIDRLLGEGTWRERDRDSKALVHEPHLHVLLTALKAGARLDRHQTEAPVSLQGLRGKVRISLPDETVELTSGTLLILEAGVPHEVEAVEESVFLITLGWPR